MGGFSMEWLTPEQILMIKCMRAFDAWLSCMGSKNNTNPYAKIPNFNDQPTSNNVYRRKGKHTVTRKYGRRNRPVRPKDEYYYRKK